MSQMTHITDVVHVDDRKIIWYRLHSVLKFSG